MINIFLKHIESWIRNHFLTMVDLVSDSLNDAGDAQITIVVFALPPNDSWRILVSLESLDNKKVAKFVMIKSYDNFDFL